MQAPRITKVEAQDRTAVVLHLADGSAIEMVPVQTSGSAPDLDVQQTVLVALRDLLRRARRGGEGEP